MSGIILILVVFLIFGFAYRFYGNFLSRKFRIDKNRPTPAHTNYDGVDYVPAKLPVLFGHHFASISGAGPIVGPIVAAAFGWLPAALWIMFGSVFLGGVHDFGAIVASIRHRGHSIADVIEKNIGLKGKQLFLLFCWSTIVLVIAVFTNIIADTFVSSPSSATTSIYFIGLAILFGLAIYRFKVPFGLATVIGVILLFGSIYVGIYFPIHASRQFWQWSLFGYIFIASVAPVWILLQPRDYLNSFLLFALLIGGLIGVFFARPAININPFNGFNIQGIGPLFPLLFVTIACGAISGVHSLIASGTTSKQLSSESHARVIGYGGMLVEGLLAILSLVAVASLSNTEFSDFYSSKNFVMAFAEGVGRFLCAIPFLNISIHSARIFTSLAVSAFTLTTLDTVTRIGRYTFQEFFEMTEHTSVKQNILVRNRYLTTLITVACGAALTFSGKSDSIWPVFGSANQLMAALAFFTISIWLADIKENYLFTLIPGVIMLIITVTALCSLSYRNLIINHNYLLGITAVIILIMAIVLTFITFKFIIQEARLKNGQSPEKNL
ncbi:MAG TPA: carbon starvation protein A [Candidatus Marinimicrobia bacterium]|nr:carbon starvation protein A [Candidatus Neomarinimicrobiota bacterium]HRS51560.1 carbon starvation protein A [Candidatus Neomarinimicrobiota bacterium]HRU92362.1 carbon starvation protein A [Candidatus Neomarinimicrobiota bacterium]